MCSSDLKQEQQQRQELLSSPERLAEFAQAQNIEVAQAQEQLQNLFAENQIRERAYNELMETLPPTTKGVNYVSDITDLTPEQRTQFLDRAIEPLRTAIADGKINEDDAVRIVNKSLENETLQAIGMDLLSNYDGPLVENMLEVLRREPTETIKESMDNADFRDEVERIAKQSLEEQNEIGRAHV